MDHLLILRLKKQYSDLLEFILSRPCIEFTVSDLQFVLERPEKTVYLTTGEDGLMASEFEFYSQARLERLKEIEKRTK